MSSNRLFLGIGANLVPDGYQSVREGCEAAIALMPGMGIDVDGLSPWYETAPVPVSDQPWFVNAVISARSAMPPASVLAALHQIESRFGRTRTVRNEARVLDIDLLDYNGQLLEEGGLTIPHPRLDQRAFVLLPLRDLAPDWEHPQSGKSVRDLVATLDPDQQIRRMS